MSNYADWLRSKRQDLVSAPDHSGWNLIYQESTLSLAQKAKDQVLQDYDRGIALTMDGLWLGYFFNSVGLPVNVVEAKRKGLSAMFNPIDEIKRDDIKNKRIILFDLDAVTGRTINRASKELEKFNPKYIDALLIHPSTIVGVGNYKRLRKRFNLPTPNEIYSYIPDFAQAEECSEGIRVYRNCLGREAITISNKTFLGYPCRAVISNKVRKVMSLRDFKK